MALTATEVETLKKALNDADPNKLADAIAKINLGTMVTPLKRTFTGLTSAATQNLTLIDATGETVGALNANRLAALAVIALRVTAGAAAAGARFITDVGGTASTTVALLSDNGQIVTFEAAVTAFVIEYIPRSAADLNAAFATL